MIFLKKIIFIGLLSFLISYVNAKTISVSQEDIKNYPARDLYGILDKYIDLHGLSYGRTGQPVLFKGLDRGFYNSRVFLDNIPLNRSVEYFDLSEISLDIIDSIYIETSPANTSSLNIFLFRKNPDNTVPFSEIIYRDAFFNHRNLSALISQKFNDDISFNFYSDITDYKDYREYSDGVFKYPYQKQNYDLQLKLPVFWGQAPELGYSFFREKIYELSLDSTLYKPETHRYYLQLHNTGSEKYRNILSAVGSLKYDHLDYNSFIFEILNSFSYSSDSDRLVIKNSLKSTHIHDRTGYSEFYIEPSYIKTLRNFTGGIHSFGIISDTYDPGYSLKLNLDQKFPYGLFANTSHSIYESNSCFYTDKLKFIRNDLFLGSTFSGQHIRGSISSGLNITEYLNTPDSILNIPYSTIKYFKTYFNIEFNKKLKFDIQYAQNIKNKVIINSPDYSLITKINFTDSYYKGNFTLSATVFHKYSNFFISDQDEEIINDLGFNLRAKIIDIELFFGIDNVMKYSYEINGEEYILNENYGYQTIKGYDMQRFDEIWGIRWIFRY